MQKKRGRPRKPKAERRGKPLRILMNPSEREAIERAAAARSMDASTWARMVLLEAAKSKT